MPSFIHSINKQLKIVITLFIYQHSLLLFLLLATGILLDDYLLVMLLPQCWFSTTQRLFQGCPSSSSSSSQSKRCFRTKSHYLPARTGAERCLCSLGGPDVSNRCVSSTSDPVHTLQQKRGQALSADTSNKGCVYYCFNNNNNRPLTPKSMPPAGDEHAKLKTQAPNNERKKQRKNKMIALPLVFLICYRLIIIIIYRLIISSSVMLMTVLSCTAFRLQRHHQHIHVRLQHRHHHVHVMSL